MIASFVKLGEKLVRFYFEQENNAPEDDNMNNSYQGYGIQILPDDCEPILDKYNLLANLDEYTGEAIISDCNGDALIAISRDITGEEFERILLNLKPPIQSRKLDSEKLKSNLINLFRNMEPET